MIDRIVVSVCVLILLASVYLMVDERILFKDTANATDLQIIATMNKASKDVRRRLEQDVVWLPIRDQDAIYQADSIFNGESADAEVSFKDGSKVMINTGSLVVLRKDEGGQTKLNIEKGTITASIGSKKPFVFVSQGKETKVSGDNAKVMISSQKGVGSAMTVLSGQVEMKIGGKSQVLKKNQAAMVNKDGQITGVKTFPIELKGAAADSAFRSTPGEPIPLAWKALAGSKYYVVEVSRDETFKNRVLAKKTRTPFLMAKKLAGQGTFYWRVLARTKKGGLEESPISKFTIAAESIPRPMLPPYDRILKVAQSEFADRGPATASSGKSMKVLLQWQDESGATDFKIQMARDEGFKKVLTEEKVKGFLKETSPLGEGKYFWRVKVEDPARAKAPWSKVSTFAIVASALEGAPTIKLPKPQDQIILNAKQNAVDFSWNKRDGATAYALEVSASPDFSGKAIVYSKRVSDLKHSVSTLKYGTYYWRVRGITGNGEVTEFSEPVRFDVLKKRALPAPKILNKKLQYETSWLYRFLDSVIPDAYAAETQGVTLKWDEVEGAAKYKIEISKTKDFRAILYSEEVTGTNLPWKSKTPGKYYWHVAGITSDGDIGMASEPAEIEVSLAPPTAITNGVVMDKVNTSKGIKSPKAEAELKWTKVSHAASYEVQVAEEPSFENAITKKIQGNTPQTKVQVPSAGKFVWRVRPLDQKAEPVGRFSKPKEIEVQKVVTNPSLAKEAAKSGLSMVTPSGDLVPATGYTPPHSATAFGILKWEMPENPTYTHKQFITFRWKKEAKAKAYRLKIFHLDGPTSDARAPASIKNLNIVKISDKNKYLINPLTPGRYMAQVEATEGIEADTGYFFFDIRRAKPLEFERIDLSLSYMASLLNYSATFSEVGSQLTVSSMLASSIGVDANLWFPDSDAGVKVSGTAGGFVVNNNALSRIDLALGAIVNFGIDASHTKIQPYFGGRLWTTPLVIPAGPTPSSGNLFMMNPTLTGAWGGIDIQQPVSDHVALSARAQYTLPLTSSNTGVPIFSGILPDKVSSQKFELGVKLAAFDHSRLFGLVGQNKDLFSWTSVASMAGPAGGKSNVTIDEKYFRVGIEVADDGPGFFAAEGKPRQQAFSEFDLTTDYSARTLDLYSLQLNGNSSTGVTGLNSFLNLPGLNSSRVTLDSVGWFKNSKNGIRFSFDYQGFQIDQYNTIGYPAYSLQWGFRPVGSRRDTGFEIQNFLGARAWSVPPIESGGNSGGNQNFVTGLQVLGPTDTLSLQFKFTNWLALETRGEISVPLAFTNRGTNYGAINPNYTSYNYGGYLKIRVFDDLLLNAGYSIRTEMLRYLLGNAGDPVWSSADLNNRGAHLGLTYNF